jgi:hypothetical protein
MNLNRKMKSSPGRTDQHTRKVMEAALFPISGRLWVEAETPPSSTVRQLAGAPPRRTFLTPNGTTKLPSPEREGHGRHLEEHHPLKSNATVEEPIRYVAEVED